MKQRRSPVHRAKPLFAMLSIAMLVAVAARDLAPNTPVPVVLVCAFGGAAALALVILLVMWIKFAINQFLINAGSIDTQWLWFKSDPQGLQDLRGRCHPTTRESRREPGRPL